MIGKKVVPVENLPIEFKKVDIEDFDSNFYQVEKEIISPNEDGYISNELLPILNEDYETTNTVVINAGVGQGKSKALIDIVSRYSADPNYIVVIAVPYKNLIKQYISDCIKTGINAEKVFDIQEIDNYDFLKDKSEMTMEDMFNVKDTDLINEKKISDFKVHVMTINALLGNSGETIIFQAKKRVKYFRRLITYCEKSNKKLVVFIDEIHDSIHNFKEEYIFGLWQFQNIIKKFFVVSATFNEASKEVIKYLSEFTNHSIKIIESQRIPISSKQSELNFILNDYGSISKNKYFDELIRDLIDNNKSFDLICYSKKQIQLLIKDSYLSKIKDDINLCYNDVFDFENDVDKHYDCEKINVGTNFTTGVNIEKLNHTYIIILPKRSLKEFINNRGVFTNGANAVIQTLARQRKKGKIYIIMPTPYQINAKSLPFAQELKNQINLIFNKYALEGNVNYSDINKDKILLENAYNLLLSRFKIAKEKIEATTRIGMNSLEYLTKERFILEKGENYLTHKFFDGDLSTYTFFTAITNQFLNCKIENVYSDSGINLDEDFKLEDIGSIYRNYILQKVPPILINKAGEDLELSGEEYYKDYYSEYSILQKMLETIPNKKITIGGKKASARQIRDISRQILLFVISKGQSVVISEMQDEKKLRKFLTSFYFQSCVASSTIPLHAENDTFYTLTNFGDKYYFTHNTSTKIKLYSKWNIFIDSIERSIFEDEKFLYTKPNEEFRNQFTAENMIENIDELIAIDSVLRDEFIPFKDSLARVDVEKKVENFYSLLINSFFITDDFKPQRTMEDGSRIRFYRNVRRKNLNNFKINLLYDRIPDAIL
ncbi:DEAD/DEAH box helicase [uncultured Chryseobacterium sp.]|uniref:DEAD/DEAH box helicase n=1 Tax=uncultured Chryseobacterium sp. TaxID=259322 RepID=UPI0025E459FE|nr:DEAD/DEAH box helicase [uncultured Chryseobacterium sp.]